MRSTSLFILASWNIKCEPQTMTFFFVAVISGELLLISEVASLSSSPALSF